MNPAPPTPDQVRFSNENTTTEVYLSGAGPALPHTGVDPGAVLDVNDSAVFVVFARWFDPELQPVATTTSRIARRLRGRVIRRFKNTSKSDEEPTDPLMCSVPAGFAADREDDTLRIARGQRSCAAPEWPRSLADIPLTDAFGYRDIFSASISERYEALIEASDDAIIATSLDATILSWNPAAERIFGFPAEQVLGQRLSLIVPADRAGETVRILHSVGRGAHVARLESVRTRRNGSRFDVRVTVAAIRESSGRIVGALTVTRDLSDANITERHEVDEALRTSERRFRLLAENARDLIFRIGLRPEPHVEYVSPASVAITGFTPEELYENPLLATGLIAPEHVRTMEGLLDAGALSEPVDVAVRRKDGTVIWVSQQLTFVNDISGALIAVEGIVRDITDRKRVEEELTYAGLHDALTGLPNRLLLRDRLDLARIRADAEGRSVIVVALDLDDFTLINDTHGHDTGDAVLVAVADLLSGATGGHATVARTGSDEFVVVGDDIADDADAFNFVDRLRDALVGPIRHDGIELFVRARIGVTVEAPSAAPESLLRNADIALARAKQQRAGRGVEFFNSDMRTRTNERFALVGDLHRALERDEFVLHYQPIVRLAEGGIVGAEALIRWQHPERGLMSPAEFIPLAEDTGLIVDIGAWVLDQACRQLRILSVADAALVDFTMSVNVSVKQLRSPGIVKTVADAVARSGIDASKLTVEMTESVFVDDLDAIRHVLEQLRALGVRVAVDDFGTGYSSLAYLKHLPLDTLKIDQTFVDGLATDPCDEAIVVSALSISRALHLLPVAEGVETSEQLAALRALGCDAGQGFYFSEPLTADGFAALVASRPRW